MITLKMFAEKKNLLLVSLLIVLISSLTSICYGANSDYLTYYLQKEGVYNSIVNKNINGNITYDDLCNSIDSKTSIVVYREPNWNQYLYPVVIYSTEYLKNEFSGTSIKGYAPTKVYEVNRDYSIVNRTNYNSSWIWMNYMRGFYIGARDNVNGIYIAGQNNIDYFNFGDIRGEFIVGLIDTNIENLFNIAEVNVGISINEEDLTFKIYKYDSINGQKLEFIEDLIPIYIDTTIGNNYYLQASKSSYLESSDYAIYSNYNNVEDIIDIAYIVVESSSGGGGGTIVIPSGESGQITTPSGENGGNIDLTGVQNRLDGVNQNLGVINDSINQLPGKIGNTFYNSGDSSGDNKGIVQKIYDDLFTVDDNYLEEKIDELGSEMGISGELLKESTELVLSVYDENKKGDFIISWEPFYLEEVLMIPSGDVNFSKIERDVPAVQDLMFWVRLILSFSCFGLLLRQIWFLILATIGVTTSIYEDHVEEENALIGQTYETISTSKLQDGVRTTISHRRRLGK